MKIKQITIHGFRGFNKSQDIPFDPRLTLLSAPNSYGKTSISEALEWIISGVTSKVEQAGSKEEYKGSYRNIHLPSDQNPSVTLLVNEGGSDFELRAELAGDSTKKLVNGSQVAEWPFSAALSHSSSPFVLQHALKDLLLATPGDRFDSFARLLGFSELGQIHKDLISLCTKPPLPTKITGLLGETRAIEERVSGRPQFASITKALKRGRQGIGAAYELVEKKCKEFVPKGTAQTSLLPQLLKVREEAVKKIFSGTVVLNTFSPVEDLANASDEQFFAQALPGDLITKYSSLVKLKAIQHVRDLAELFGIGDRLLEENAAVCPLCDRPLETSMREHIHKRHELLVQQKQEYGELEIHRAQVEKVLDDLEEHLSQHFDRCSGKVAALIQVEPSLDALKPILIPKYQIHYEAISAAIAGVKKTKLAFEGKYEATKREMGIVRRSIIDSDEGTDKINKLSTAVAEYLAVTVEFKQALKAHSGPVTEAAQVLKYELDTRAGTEDVSVLIDLLEKRDAIRKQFMIEEVIEELKDLRQRVDKFVSQIMLDAISGEFGSEVMEWYGKIRTTGDPDVHFAGFDMKKTAQGGRVQIKARSYGKDLVSAVSSLSESKLNALGLCISIAINTKTPGLFEFLVIDDPIQSWDAEHETKFIEVIKELVVRGKQVILLSHNDRWIKQVRAACGELNGTAYEITSFTEEGPHISQVPWAEIEQRFATIKGIIDNPNADKIVIQQGEEEVRQVLTQLAAELCFRVTGHRKNTSNLNAAETKKLLLAGGIAPDVVNKLVSTFETVDDAHHAATNYSAHRDRLRTYYDWLRNLQNEVKNRATSPKT
jgi:AAA domain